MTPISVEGNVIVKEKVVAIGKIEPITYGSLAYMWEHGFKIFLEGNVIEIVGHRKSNDESKEVLKEKISALRDKLIQSIFPSEKINNE